MTATVLPLPLIDNPLAVSDIRDARGPARVTAFPPARNIATVNGIAREMRETGSEEKAEAILAAHLEVEATWLHRAGIDEVKIEIELSAFARAAWRAYDLDENDIGAA